MASIELVSRTQTSLTCRATGLPSNANMIRWYIGVATSDMPYQGYCSIAMDDWPCFTFTGLSPGTTYLVKISVRAADQSAIGGAVTLSFSTLPARPANWAWESTVSKGSPINLTAAEWNRFLDRIFAFVEYKGLTLQATAANYYVTKGSPMIMGQFNAALATIDAMSPPVAPPSRVLRGTTITAADFNGLKDSLNSIV